jgi:hypothetical protein
VAECASGDALKLAAKLIEMPASRFVFRNPDVVRMLLERSENLKVANAVRETLWLSACGSGRSFTEGEVDPEYRYILEQGEALANRYRDDGLLASFYRMIADTERRDLDLVRKDFAAGDLD